MYVPALSLRVELYVVLTTSIKVELYRFNEAPQTNANAKEDMLMRASSVAKRTLRKGRQTRNIARDEGGMQQ